MQSKNADKECYDANCHYHGKRHYHVLTNNGGYAKFIVDRPQEVPIKQYQYKEVNEE